MKSFSSVSKLALVFLVMAGLWPAGRAVAAGLGTEFFYQGRLNNNANPANGVFDLRFELLDAASGGSTVGVAKTNLAVPITNGLFTANLDFGAVFVGSARWLSVGVRTNGNTNAFTQLLPLQPLLPAPNALYASAAGNLLGSLSATQLVGTLPSAQIAGIYSGGVNFTNSTNQFAGFFAGNGSNLTTLNASSVSFGTLADARLSTNVALLNADQIYSGTNLHRGVNSFTNQNNAFAGNGSNLTTLNASSVSFGTLADARLSTNVALLNADQIYSGTNLHRGVNSFTNRNNAFTGSFFGNGLVGWVPVYGTATQAVANAGYLLLNSNLSSVTLPPTANVFVGDIVRVSGSGSGGWQILQNAGQRITGLFYSVSNAAWIATSAANAGWRALASSAEGSRMVAAAGGGGGIYSSTDYGLTWNSSTLTYSPGVLACSADGSRIVGATRPGGVILSTNAGSTWSVITPGSFEWSAVCMSSDGSKFASSISNSTIYVWNNFGATSNAPTAPSLGWSGMAASADLSRLAAIVYGGTIYTSGNGGSSWAASSAPTANWTAIAASADGNKFAAAVSGGRIYTSTNAGTSWTQQVGSPAAFWTAIAMSSDGGRIIATINADAIYVSTDFGLTWTRQSVPTQNWRAVACSSDGTRTIAGYAATTTTGGIYRWFATQQLGSTLTGTSGSLNGSPGSAIELQHLGNGLFMPIGGVGTYWAN